ncbi:MAG: GIY-YIG nuclease family protein [Elusimicrobia bacterium]|nr:GIY-YIG nuclease family protein [Elusimicrobiota bacterium]
MLKCADDTLYTGYTINLEHRLKLHNAGQGAKYLRGRKPGQLAYVKRYKDLKAALQAEYTIKKLKRSQKESLVRKYALLHPNFGC